MTYDEIQQAVDRIYSCNCSEKKVRYKTSKVGTKIFYLQCTRCGDYTRIAKDKVTSPNSPLIQPLDEALRQNWWTNKSDYSTKLREQSQNQERQAWFDWYNKYLSSPEWKAKRAEVLRRARGVCEGCLNQEAVQVHHLTYKRVGNEMLFDLVAVCNDCHNAIHESES